jgi:hypothetical protein
MNNRSDNIIIVTAALNACIVVLAGHGISVLGLLEYAWFPFVNSDYFSLNIFSSYDSNIGAACAFSLAGQLAMLISLCFRNPKYLQGLIVGGVVSSSIGFLYLVHGTLFGDQASFLSLLTGIPFMVAAARMVMVVFQLGNG